MRASFEAAKKNLEAAARMCSLKNVTLEISQNS